MTAPVGKLLAIVGGILMGVGLAVWGLGRLGFRGLPGDIHIKTDHVHFYFPLVTCLVLSAVLTAALWLWSWLQR